MYQYHTIITPLFKGYHISITKQDENHTNLIEINYRSFEGLQTTIYFWNSVQSE